MKLYEKKTKRSVEIYMYLVSNDKMRITNELTQDFFDGVIYVDDVDYCADQVKDWVDGINDFADEDGLQVTQTNEYRLAEINGELYSNYDI